MLNGGSTQRDQPLHSSLHILAPSSSPETKPVIDFYQVLKDRKVDIPISDEDQAAIDNPTLNKEASGQSILQVGSFQSAADAESLKAELAFLGLQARVESAQVNDDTWHRVQLGPFDSESRLSQARNLLIENDIKYMQRSAIRAVWPRTESRIYVEFKNLALCLGRSLLQLAAEIVVCLERIVEIWSQ